MKFAISQRRHSNTLNEKIFNDLGTRSMATQTDSETNLIMNNTSVKISDDVQLPSKNDKKLEPKPRNLETSSGSSLSELFTNSTLSSIGNATNTSNHFEDFENDSDAPFLHQELSWDLETSKNYCGQYFSFTSDKNKSKKTKKQKFFVPPLHRSSTLSSNNSNKNEIENTPFHCINSKSSPKNAKNDNHNSVQIFSITDKLTFGNTCQNKKNNLNSQFGLMALLLWQVCDQFSKISKQFFGSNITAEKVPELSIDDNTLSTLLNLICNTLPITSDEKVLHNSMYPFSPKSKTETNEKQYFASPDSGITSTDINNAIHHSSKSTKLRLDQALNHCEKLIINLMNRPKDLSSLVKIQRSIKKCVDCVERLNDSTPLNKKTIRKSWTNCVDWIENYLKDLEQNTPNSTIDQVLKTVNKHLEQLSTKNCDFSTLFSSPKIKRRLNTKSNLKSLSSFQEKTANKTFNVTNIEEKDSEVRLLKSTHSLPNKIKCQFCFLTFPSRLELGFHNVKNHLNRISKEIEIHKNSQMATPKTSESTDQSMTSKLIDKEKLSFSIEENKQKSSNELTNGFKNTRQLEDSKENVSGNFSASQTFISSDSSTIYSLNCFNNQLQQLSKNFQGLDHNPITSSNNQTKDSLNEENCLHVSIKSESISLNDSFEENNFTSSTVSSIHFTAFPNVSDKAEELKDDFKQLNTKGNCPAHRKELMKSFLSKQNDNQSPKDKFDIKERIQKFNGVNNVLTDINNVKDQKNRRRTGYSMKTSPSVHQMAQAIESLKHCKTINVASISPLAKNLKQKNVFKETKVGRTNDFLFLKDTNVSPSSKQFMKSFEIVSRGFKNCKQPEKF